MKLLQCLFTTKKKPLKTTIKIKKLSFINAEFIYKLITYTNADHSYFLCVHHKKK